MCGGLGGPCLSTKNTKILVEGLNAYGTLLTARCGGFSSLRATAALALVSGVCWTALVGVVSGRFSESGGHPDRDPGRSREVAGSIQGGPGRSRGAPRSTQGGPGGTSRSIQGGPGGTQVVPGR